MTIRDAWESLTLKFKSGNDVPVARAAITREEWDIIEADSAQEFVIEMMVLDNSVLFKMIERDGLYGVYEAWKKDRIIQQERNKAALEEIRRAEGKSDTRVGS